MKKTFIFISIIIVLTLLAALPATSHHTWKFPDVSAIHPNYTAVEYLRSRNLVFGYNDGTFRLYTDVSRAGLVDMVLQARNISDPGSTFYNNCFSDVKWEWYADEVCYAKSAGWLDSYGTKFLPTKKATWSEAARLIELAFSNASLFSDSESNARIDRGEVAQLLYAGVLGSGTYIYSPPPPLQPQPAIWVNPYSVNVPKGYPQPWVPSSVPTYLGGYFPPQPYNPPALTYGATCQSLGISPLPSHTAATYTTNYCPFDSATGAPLTQILLGQANLYPVWGENFNFTVTDKMRAMAVAYASEMFNLNPNYLNAIAVKESKMNCMYYGGCFQITGGFPEVRNRYPLYFDANDSESTLTSSFETAVVIAGLYVRFTEALWDSLYQFRAFYQNAADSETRVKLANRGYNRGPWDTAIRDMLQANRTTCQAKGDILQCFPSGSLTSPDGIALDHSQAITNYCRSLMQSNNFYDVTLTRQDITDFIERVLKPTFSQTASVNWTLVSQRANDAFGCLQNAGATISFRYDFKTLLRELKEVLPPMPGPIL